MRKNGVYLLTKTLMCAIIVTCLDWRRFYMKEKKCFKERIKQSFLRYFFAFLLIISGGFGLINSVAVQNVYADPDTSEEIDTSNETNNEEPTEETSSDDGETTAPQEEKVPSPIKDNKNCQNELGSIGWLVCPTTGKISEAIDWIYHTIEDLLVVNPVEAKDGTPIYEIWKYCRGVTNVVFIIFLLVVIYSQITGLGISNYGLKKALPKLIIAAVLVNLSFLICQLGIDVSNVIGNSLRGVFTSVEETVVANMQVSAEAAESLNLAYSELYGALAGGASLSLAAGAIAFETGTIWMLIPVVLGAIVAVASGLITIALRQAVVALLVMVAPLAIVANILPNTEGLFKKWKDLLIKMLVFYPMFSLLFGASSLAGFALIASAKDAFWVILGLAVQVFPLFFSWSLMKMSGTVLGTINAKMRGFAARPLASNRAWAESRMLNRRANTLNNGRTASAKLMQYLEKRKALREEDTKNALEAFSGKKSEYVQRKIAGSDIGEMPSNSRRASRYTRNAKSARNYSLISSNAVANTEHVMGNYSSYYDRDYRDKELNVQSQHAWLDYVRAAHLKDIDEENDINFAVDRYLAANKRDANNNPIDAVAFNRYIKSVAGPDGEQRLSAKIISQAAKVESKQRSEYAVWLAKYGLNGYNKRAFRCFMAGYLVDDDGWATDANGERLRNEDGSYVETVRGDALTKAPEKLVLYDKRDEKGLYFDFKDQDGNVIARIHRGKGDDGNNHDDAAFIKETFSNYDIPIADPINDVYSILSGVSIGDIITPQGQNEIGLSRYSTTVGRAMKDYKGNATWAGSMFNSGVGNRQIKNAAQHAIWVLDSIKKTSKPGGLNTQNPASIEYLTALMNPDNWEKIFTEEEIANAVNINNELFGGEDWVLDENGNIIDHIPVENPNYEQRMNTIKRKLIFPAMKKILPAFDRLRTSNTIDNQKPGTADAQYEFLKMVEEKWEHNPDINFDPLLVDQDLQSEAIAFRQRKHDKDGNLIYARQPQDNRDNHTPRLENLANLLGEAYYNSLTAEELKDNVFRILDSREEYSRALERFDELCNENPNATMDEISGWFSDLDILVRY